jgi:glycosyltransferase involved in cell wall biosynthesis
LQKTVSSSKDNLHNSKKSPLVSVLVPTYNSERTIKKCLESIKAQTYQNIEIIVIDNFSLDKTRKIAETLGAKTFRKGTERSAQMNYGALCAGGKYILRVDSDMILDKDLIEKCLEPCYNGVEAVIVPVLPHPSGPNNFWVSCRMLETRMLMDDMVNVAPRFIDRSVFLAIGGYDEAIVAWEDYDLHNRLLESKCRVSLLQDSALWHLGEASCLREVVIRMINYGKTDSLSLFTKKHGLKGLKQISIVRPSFFRHRNYFITDPLHFTGLIFMKLVQTSSVGVGALARKSDSN